MKVYYFMVISIGLMMLFNLAGIETGSSKLLDLFQFNQNQSAVINPTDYTATDVANINSSSSIWIALAIAIALFGISTIRLIAGFGSSQSPTDSILAVLSGFIFIMVALDFYSVYVLVKEITGGIGWEYNLTWILSLAFLAGFVVSIVQFIKGTD